MRRNCGTTKKMQMQLTSVILLFLLCNGLCSDIDQGKRAIEEEVLRSLLTSKVKQSKHIAPLWQLPLQDVCRMMNRLGESWQEAWGSEEQQEDAEGQADYDQRVSGSLAQMLEEMHDLQNLCRVLQPRELQDDQEYLELDQNSDSPLKRKSPYILKRQLRTNKSRRPYILKRSVYY
ncbi:neurotensin/neuromedin N [Sinocyclocheilus rhinocerous]|uniref:neurotensin/neuromedin N n=1 Tax=Sinocyclocheilus rhinocerous TaxID=307959 RepID=UPI0007B98A87|nr:PREDICTED: neurotensin/neuromedin N [Sinocyclocheilus rhinocerous]